jgi:hypothetical protein
MVMVLFSIGLPGRFGDWCEAVIARIAERALGRVTTVSPNKPEELTTALLNEEGGHLFVSGRQPGAWLCRLLSATGKPVVVALDDPRKTVAEVMRQHGLGLADTVRQVGSGCAAMIPWTALPGALVLQADRDWSRPAETVSAIARHLGLACAAADVEGIIADLTALGLAPEAGPAAFDLDHLGETNLGVVNGALGPYLNLFLGAPLGPISWARDLFMMDGHQPATQIVDITGRVRALIYGPYIKLPLGHWSAEVVLGFSQEAREINFAVDILMGGSPVAATNIRPAHEGVFSVKLSFVVEEGNDHEVEFRVVNERAAFDGKIAIGHAVLTRQTEVAGESNAAVDLLKAELGLS